MRGLVALLEYHKEMTFKQLLEASPQGEHALRHLLKKAKRLNLIEIPVVRNDKMRFQTSKYRLTAFAHEGQIALNDYAPEPDEEELAA